MLSGVHPFLSGGESALGGAIRDGAPTVAVVGTERHLVHFTEAMLLAGPATVIEGVGIRGVPTRRGAIDAADGQARLGDIRWTHQKESARITLSFDGRLPLCPGHFQVRFAHSVQGLLVRQDFKVLE